MAAVMNTPAADPTLAGDIARIHVEAIGGESRLLRLDSLRAAGVTRVGEAVMDFTLWAQRPNRIRIEVTESGRTLVQGWDGGAEAPWVRNGDDAAVVRLEGAVRDSFVAEAEFDSPLFQPETRGIALEYLGEETMDGQKIVRLSATPKEGEPLTLFLAADTYFIVRQDRKQPLSDGGSLETQTYFADFRPVLGVILPHRITVCAGERTLHEVILNWMEPNPPVGPDTYAAPK